MTPQEAIKSPLINAFDIIPDKWSEWGFKVFTWPHEGETEDEYYERDNKNFQKALQLKKYKNGRN